MIDWDCTDTLKKGLSLLCIPWDENTIEGFKAYIKEIMLWNSGPGKGKPGIRLLGGNSPGEITGHILDSLSAYSLIRDFNLGSLADIGSGAGFPGLVLSLLFPDSLITLIERSGRKAAFLRSAAAVLGSKNVRVLEADLKTVKQKYDAAVFRALGKVSEFYSLVMPLLNPGGRIIAYKGTKASAEMECEELLKRGYTKGKIEIYPLKVPFSNEERNVMIITA